MEGRSDSKEKKQEKVQGREGEEGRTNISDEKESNIFLHPDQFLIAAENQKKAGEGSSGRVV